MMVAVRAQGDVLLTFEYDTDTGKDWCIIRDAEVLAWLIDDKSATAHCVTEPYPVIVGDLPKTPPNTSPILSPFWAVGQDAMSMVVIPNVFRGSGNDLLNFLATNNGAQRKLYAELIGSTAAVVWQQWCQVNPGLALSSPPNV